MESNLALGDRKITQRINTPREANDIKLLIIWIWKPTTESITTHVHSVYLVSTSESWICCQSCCEMSLKILLIFKKIIIQNNFLRCSDVFMAIDITELQQLHTIENFLFHSVKAMLSNMFGLWPSLKEIQSTDDHLSLVANCNQFWPSTKVSRD